MKRSNLTPHDIRRASVEVPCDPRTILAFIEGRRMHPTSKARVGEVLRQLGLLPAAQPASPVDSNAPPPRAA